jgi:hypothetical protein
LNPKMRKNYGEPQTENRQTLHPRKDSSETRLGNLSRIGHSNLANLMEYLDNPAILGIITTCRSGTSQAKEASECAVAVATAWAETIRKENEEEADLHFGMRNLRRAWDSEASSSQEEQSWTPSGEQRRTPDTCGLSGTRIGEAKNPGPANESQSQSSASSLERGETTRGQDNRRGGGEKTLATKEKEGRRANPPGRKRREPSRMSNPREKCGPSSGKAIPQRKHRALPNSI